MTEVACEDYVDVVLNVESEECPWFCIEDFEVMQNCHCSKVKLLMSENITYFQGSYGYSEFKDTVQLSFLLLPDRRIIGVMRVSHLYF